MGCRSWYGALVSANSIAVMPNDQMSHLLSYGLDLSFSHTTTSGAIHCND